MRAPASSASARDGAPSDRPRASAVTATQIDAFRPFIAHSFTVRRVVRDFCASGGRTGSMQAGKPRRNRALRPRLAQSRNAFLSGPMSLAGRKPPRRTCATHALRHRHENGSWAGRGGAAVLADERAYPADRSQGAAEPEASKQVKEAAVVPG